MTNLQVQNLLKENNAGKIKYLDENEINRLTKEFQNYFDYSKRRLSAGKYWITFLFLRYTGARISEVLNIDDTKDIDYRNSRVSLVTLKRNRKKGKKIYRTIPLPVEVINELLKYSAEYPSQRGKIFEIDRSNFHKKMQQIGKKAGIEKDKLHPHSLRHTRAIELINANVPLNHIQNLLGHASILTTSIYLQVTGKELEEVMRERNLI